jgi:hypothetical protein
MPGLFDYLFGNKDARDDLNSGGMGSSMQPKEILPLNPLPKPGKDATIGDLLAYEKSLKGPEQYPLLTGMPNTNNVAAPSPEVAPPVAETPPPVQPLPSRQPSAAPNKLIENGKRIKELQANPVQNAAPVGDVLSKLLGSNSDELKDAQQQRNQLQLMAILGRAGQQAGAAIANRANIKPDDEAYRTLLAAAEQPVSDVKAEKAMASEALKNKKLESEAKTEMQKSNPNSDISKTYRDLYRKTTGKDAPSNTTATELEKLEPILARLHTSEENRKDRQLKMSELKSARDEKQLAKNVVDMGYDLDSNRRGAGEMGKNQARVNAAGRVNELITQFPDYNMPHIQAREVATSVAGLLNSGSQSAVSQINELVPKTWQGSVAKIEEYIKGIPVGEKQQEFMKLMHETAIRERDLAKEQILEAKFEKAYGTWGRVKKDNPDEFYRVLAAKTGVPVAEIEEMEQQEGFMGRYIPKSKEKESEHNKHSPNNEVERLDPKSGKIVVYDAKTKKPIRWK